jgi:hypothetical protein
MKHMADPAGFPESAIELGHCGPNLKTIYCAETTATVLMLAITGAPGSRLSSCTTCPGSGDSSPIDPAGIAQAGLLQLEVAVLLHKLIALRFLRLDFVAVLDCTEVLPGVKQDKQE